MTKQRGEDPQPKARKDDSPSEFVDSPSEFVESPSEFDDSPSEFIDVPENMPGDQDKAPKKP